MQLNSIDLKFFRESLIGLGITVFGGLITGVLWGAILPVFGIIVGIISLIPVISQMRGNISGIFTSRLGTGLHLGSINPSLKDRTSALNNSIYMNLILSFILPIWVSFIVYVFHFLSGGQTALIRFLSIGLLGSFICGSIQIVITILISFSVYRRGMDPDVLVYPILSFIADIITILSLVIAFILEGYLYDLILRSFPLIFELFGIFVLLAFLIMVFSRPIRSKLEFELGNLLAESVPVLMTTVIIGSLVGILMSNNLPYQGIILILPIFMAYTGSMGAIVGSTYTTAYYLGTPLRDFYFSTSTVLIFLGTVLSLVLGLVGYSISIFLEFSLPNDSLFSYLFVCLGTGIISTLFSILISLLLGNITFKRGIDADNVIVPITSTLGDLVAIISIVMSVNFFYS